MTLRTLWTICRTSSTSPSRACGSASVAGARRTSATPPAGRSASLAQRFAASGSPPERATRRFSYASTPASARVTSGKLPNPRSWQRPSNRVMHARISVDRRSEPRWSRWWNTCPPTASSPSSPSSPNNTSTRRRVRSRHSQPFGGELRHARHKTDDSPATRHPHDTSILTLAPRQGPITGPR